MAKEIVMSVLVLLATLGAAVTHSTEITKTAKNITVDIIHQVVNPAETIEKEVHNVVDLRASPAYTNGNIEKICEHNPDHWKCNPPEPSEPINETEGGIAF